MHKSGEDGQWMQLPITNLDRKASYSSLLFKNYIIMIGGIVETCGGGNPFARGGIGGFTPTLTITNEIVIIDLEKNTWKKTLPNSNYFLPRHSHTACLYHEDKIIIYGGIDAGGFGTAGTLTLNDMIEITLSDIETPRIEVRILIPEDRTKLGKAYHTSHIYQNQMFSFGGLADNNGLIGTGDLSKLDLDRVEWITCQTSGDIPSSLRFIERYCHCSILYKDKIYLIGGKTKSIFFDDIHEFEIPLMKWRKITPIQGLMLPRGFASSVEVDGIVYIFGGEGPNKPGSGGKKSSNIRVINIFGTATFGGSITELHNDLFTYDIVENKVQQVIRNGPPPVYRSRHGMVFYKNNLLILGGKLDATILSLQINVKESNDSQIKEVRQVKNVFGGNHEDYVFQLKSLLFDKMYSDVTFQIQNEEIPAHKNILARRCKYFHNMFTSGMMESHSSIIKLDGVALEPFKALLEFVYCNEIKLDENLALDLVELSDKHSFGELTEVCGRFLGQSLTLQNYVEFSKAADKFDISVLKNAILNFVTKNLRQIQQSDNLGDLSKSILWEIIFKLGLK